MPFKKGNEWAIKPGEQRNPEGVSGKRKEARLRCQQWIWEEGGFEILKGIAEGKGLATDQAKVAMFLYEQAEGKAVTQIAGAEGDDFSKLKIVIERATESAKATE